MKSPVSHLHRYKAILFDMNETFMFGRDIGPAKALGMATCWIAAGGSMEAVDFCIPSITALTVAPAPPVKQSSNDAD